jgi:hypothetical protein
MSIPVEDTRLAPAIHSSLHSHQRRGCVRHIPEQLGSRESFLCDHRRPSNVQADKMEYALAQSIPPLLTIFSIRLIDAGLIFEEVPD